MRGRDEWEGLGQVPQAVRGRDERDGGKTGEGRDRSRRQ